MLLLYEGRLKSSWTVGSAPLLCRGRHNSGALPTVHELFKRPSYDIFEYILIRVLQVHRAYLFKAWTTHAAGTIMHHYMHMLLISLSHSQVQRYGSPNWKHEHLIKPTKPCFKINILKWQRQVKVEIFLSLTKYHAMRTYWGAEV